MLIVTTGSAKHNQWLSEERAKTLAGELVKMGVESSKISQVGKGGVDTLTPIFFQPSCNCSGYRLIRIYINIKNRSY